MMRLIAFLLLTFGFLKNSSAQVVYSFLPNPATAADAVRLRIDIFKCFDHVLVTSVDANAKTVTVRFNGDDDLCDDTVPANTVTPPNSPMSANSRRVFTTPASWGASFSRSSARPSTASNSWCRRSAERGLRSQRYRWAAP